MSRLKLVLLIALPLATAGTLVALAVAQSGRVPTRTPVSSPTAPIQTRQTSFSIPFQVDDLATAPAEVRLFLSTDRGQTWQLADRARPQDKHFSFRATRDGLYWFSLRTVDVVGRLHPPGPHSTGLRVNVDTRKPKLSVYARQGSAGEVTIRWDGSDDNLRPESLKLSYRVDANASWRPIMIDPTPQRRSVEPAERGSTIWWPNQSIGNITIRAEIADDAGNTTIAQDRLRLIPSSLRPKQPRPNVTVGLSSDVAPSIGTERRTTTDDRSPIGSNAHGAQPWPVDKISDVSMRRSLEIAAPSSTRERTALRPRHATVQPSVQDRKESKRPLSYKDLLPPGERPHMVRSASFNLRYDVRSVGPSGIGKVQLWETRDGGRTWQENIVDHDRTSPLVAKVPSPGLYGFRITVQNQRGEGGIAPQDGDLPEVWIGFDPNRPQVSIEEAIPTGDVRGRELDIRWHATDEHLTTRPVTLLFATRPNGPWTTIAAGLKNTGGYRWKLNPRLSRSVYLRLEVRDAAGNLGISQSAQPVSLSVDSPTTQLRTFEPTDTTAAKPLTGRRR